MPSIDNIYIYIYIYIWFKPNLLIWFKFINKKNIKTNIFNKKQRTKKQKEKRKRKGGGGHGSGHL